MIIILETIFVGLHILLFYLNFKVHNTIYNSRILVVCSLLISMATVLAFIKNDLTLVILLILSLIISTVNTFESLKPKVSMPTLH